MKGGDTLELPLDTLLHKWGITEQKSTLMAVIYYLIDDPSYTKENAVEDLMKLLAAMENEN